MLVARTNLRKMYYNILLWTTVLCKSLLERLFDFNTVLYFTFTMYYFYNEKYISDQSSERILALKAVASQEHS